MPVAIFSDTIQLWEVCSGQPRGTLEGHLGIISLAFSPGGRILASSSSDGTVRLWEVSSGQHKAILRGHGDSVSSLAFSPDGRILASGGRDMVIMLWDMSPYITPQSTTEVEADASEETTLAPNAPNPFNTSTQIPYRLAASGPVRLEIYNALGQPVHTLVNQVQAAGMYQVHWDACDQGGAAVAAGVYITRLHHPNGVQTRRLLYLK